MIIGVPSNDFGAQEPDGPTEIAETAQRHYGVTFPIAAKAAVNGPNAHPFYKWAADARPNTTALTVQGGRGASSERGLLNASRRFVVLSRRPSRPARVVSTR